MSNMDSIAEAVLEECREDYVGLWSIVKEVRSCVVHEATVPERTLAILNQLLLGGEVVAGEFKGKEFSAWEVPTSSVLLRIQSEWVRLGRDPDIGEIVWLTAKT
jgi:hypothetical protein